MLIHSFVLLKWIRIYAFLKKSSRDFDQLVEDVKGGGVWKEGSATEEGVVVSG